MGKQLRATKAEKPKKNVMKRIIIGLWIAFLGGILVVTLTFFLIATGVIGYMPPIEDLENPIDKYATQVYSADGVQLGTYSQDRNNRIYSNYGDLSPYLIQALIATEDARFYSHSGIDVFALTRAVVKTAILRDNAAGGGSTISQQLAKQLYSKSAKSTIERVFQKPVEWVIAVRLERYYTKDEIINLYLSEFDFLYNASGIQSAAQVYFNKLPKDLAIEEAATLIGMCKNPSYFNPYRKNDRTKGRRNVVIDQMEKYNYLSKATADSIKKTPLVLDFKRADHKEGLAPYFREYLRMTLGAKKPERSRYADWQIQQYKYDSLQWFTNPLYGWCTKNTKADGTNYNLGTDGLKVYSTLDSRMQGYAEWAVVDHISKNVQPLFDKEKKGRSYAPFAYDERNNVEAILNRAMKRTERYRVLKNSGMSDTKILNEFKKPLDMKVFSWKGELDTLMSPWDSLRYTKGFLHAGFMAMDTHTGHVKAYVGDVDYKYFQYDMVNVGRRQVGSTIKPYLYALAMEEGMTPCDEMMHEEQVLFDENGREWRPKNVSARRVGEMVSIKWGLMNSDNWVTAYLMKHTSPYTFVDLLHSFGITGRIDPVISVSLGTHEISVAEMAGAYTAFANKGIRATPIYVTHIEDSHGNIVANFVPELHEVFSETTYVRMLDMLRGVIDGGTGGRVRRDHGVTGELGGKTGTTQNNADGWFMGFSARLSAACWVGGEENTIHFDRTRDGQGAAVSLPIYGKFMKRVYDDPTLVDYRSTDQFERLPGINPCAKAYEAAGIVDTQVEIDDVFN